MASCDLLFGRFHDQGRNSVRVAVGGRSAVFQVAFPIAFRDGIRHTDGGATIAHAPAELADVLRFVQAGQTLVVLFAVGVDVKCVPSREVLEYFVEVRLTCLLYTSPSPRDS